MAQFTDDSGKVNQMKKLVYFTGSLPKKGHAPVGGGEVGNQRTVDMLKGFGYQPIIVRRYRSNAEDSKVKKIATYPYRLVKNIVHWIIVLMQGDRKNGIVHISGFGGLTIFIESIQVYIAKLFGYTTVFELRGGGAIDFYEKGSRKYRQQFQYIVKRADYIFSQGRENEPLLKSLCDTPIFYYPNCVKPAFYLEILPEKPTDVVNLLFYGRIETEKNPMMIIETASLLQKQFDNIRLTMIGNGQKEMIEQIESRMKESLKEGTYELLPGCEHDKLQKLLVDKHFYVFPSEQPREGQSNAVTESMSLGIIPIASPQGFSRSTIGDDKLIVDELTAKAYAERIASIISAGEIKKYSHFVRQRFMDNYTEEAVFDRAKEEYKVIFATKD